MPKPTNFRDSTDVFTTLRDLRADMIAERRKIEQSGMFTSDGVADAFESSARLNDWQGTFDRAEAAIARHVQAAENRLAKARQSASAPPATVAEQTLAELRLARKLPMIQAQLDKPGADLTGLVANADPTEVAAIVDHLSNVAESGHPRADSIRASIAHGIDQRDPAIGEAADKLSHAEQLKSVLSVQFGGTRRVMESAGTRADTVADAQIDNAVDKWETPLDAA